MLQIKAWGEGNKTPAMVSLGSELLSAEPTVQEAQGHVCSQAAEIPEDEGSGKHMEPE